MGVEEICMKNKNDHTMKKRIASILFGVGVILFLPAFVLGFFGFLSGGGDIYFDEKAYGVVEIILVCCGIGFLLMWISDKLR